MYFSENLCLLGWSFQCPLENKLTLYTVMIWFRGQSTSMFLLSDNNDYDKTMVVPYTTYVPNYMKEHFGDNVHNIEIWTDELSSQFKYKYIFTFIGITLPQLIAWKVFWNYSATSHDKDAVDAFDGTIRRVATQAVAARKSNHQRCSFNVQCSQKEAKPYVMNEEYMESTLWDLGIHILGRHQRITWHNALSPCWVKRQGKVFTHMFYGDGSCTIHPLNSVELAVADKYQDTNVNIGDFAIVKYEGKFYPGEVLHLVPNQSATVSTMECSGLKFWKWHA